MVNCRFSGESPSFPGIQAQREQFDYPVPFRSTVRQFTAIGIQSCTHESSQTVGRYNCQITADGRTTPGIYCRPEPRSTCSQGGTHTRKTDLAKTPYGIYLSEDEIGGNVADQAGTLWGYLIHLSFNMWIGVLADFMEADAG